MYIYVHTCTYSTGSVFINFGVIFKVFVEVQNYLRHASQEN